MKQAFLLTTLMSTLLATGCRPSAEEKTSQPARNTNPNVVLEDQPRDNDRLQIPSVDLDKFEAASAEQIRQAQRHLETCSDVERPAAWAALAMLYHSFELYDVAESCYRQAGKEQPDDHRWSYLRGRIYETQGRLKDALSAYSESSKSLTQTAAADEKLAIEYRLGEIAIEQGRWQEAADMFTRILAKHPHADWALFCLGRIAVHNRAFDQAIEYLAPLVDRFPQASNVAYLLGTAYARSNRPELAKEYLQRSAQTKSSLSAPDPLMTAVHKLATGARRDIEQGLRMFAAKRYSEAKICFENALKTDPFNPRAHCNLGSTLKHLGDIVAAERHFEAAIDADPQFLTAHYNLGVLNAQRGNDDAAVRHYDFVLDRSPAHRKACFNRGNSLTRIGEFEKALSDMQRVIEMDPGNITARIAEARLWVLMDNYGRAVECLNQARSIKPDSLVVQHDLARIRVASPDNDVRDGSEGLKLAMHVFKKQSFLDHAVTLAMAHAEVGDFDKAIELQEAAIAAGRGKTTSVRSKQLAKNLAAYRSNQPCREPWQRDELIPQRH